MKVFRRRKQTSAEVERSGLEEATPDRRPDHAGKSPGIQVEDVETSKEVRNIADVLLDTEQHDDPRYFHRGQPTGDKSLILAQSAPRSNQPPKGSNNQNIQPSETPLSASAHRRGSANLFRRASRGMRRLPPRTQGMMFKHARDMNNQDALEAQIHERMKQSFRRMEDSDDQSGGPSCSS